MSLAKFFAARRADAVALLHALDTHACTARDLSSEGREYCDFVQRRQILERTKAAIAVYDRLT